MKSAVKKDVYPTEGGSTDMPPEYSPATPTPLPTSRPYYKKKSRETNAERVLERLFNENFELGPDPNTKFKNFYAYLIQQNSSIWGTFRDPTIKLMKIAELELGSTAFRRANTGTYYLLRPKRLGNLTKEFHVCGVEKDQGFSVKGVLLPNIPFILDYPAWKGQSEVSYFRAKLGTNYEVKRVKSLPDDDDDYLAMKAYWETGRWDDG